MHCCISDVKVVIEKQNIVSMFNFTIYITSFFVFHYIMYLTFHFQSVLSLSYYFLKNMCIV